MPVLDDAQGAPATPGFLDDSSHMSALVRDFDWASTSIGPIASWPESLRTITGFMMRAPTALVLLWGPDGVMIYNDSYSVFAGDRHPSLLGSKVLEGWPEAAELNARVMSVGLSGGTLSYTDLELVLNRTGVPQPAWLDLDYSPVIDESGKPGGVMAVVVETTNRVLAERRIASAQARQQQHFSQMPGFVAMLSGPEHVYDYVNAAYLKVAGERDFVGKPIREVFPELEGQGFFELLDQVFTTGERYVTRASAIRLAGESEDRYLDFVYEPIRDDAGAVTGVFVGGYDVSDAQRAADALRESEARLRFLDELGAAVGKVADADAVLRETTRMTGEHLGVSVCAYADMDEDQDGFTILGDWFGPGARSIVGHYSLAAFGELAVERMHAGEPLIINDNAVELPPEAAKAFQDIGVRATICMPLIKDGRLTALMAIHDKAPRVWSDHDLALLRDVTIRSWAHVQRVSAEAELRASEDNFRTLASAMPNQVWTSPPDGQLDWFNEQVYAFSGAERGSLDGDGWAVMVHPDDIPAAAERWAQALGDGEPYQTEFRLRRHDGAWRWHLARAVPLKDGQGEVVRWIGTNTDIQDQKETAQALADMNVDLERKVIERTQARGMTWQVTPDLMGALNSEGYFETSNPAWFSMLGWTEAEVASMSIWELLHPDDLERTRSGFNLTQQGEPAIRFPNRYRAKDGSYRWISWVGVPEDGMVYCTGRDITEEVAAEEELARAQEALRQSQKMEAVGQLTGGIAHDFNNLLTGIAGSMELLQKRLADGRTDGVERYIDIAQTATRRASALTQRLLAFSRRQTLDPKPTDVNRLVGGMEDLIRRTVGPAIEVEVVGAGGLWNTRVDQPQLENALLNLAINARDAMPEGGRITIETANKWLDQRAARDRDLPPGQYVSLCVTDTGTGMTPEVASRAFDPFFTTKPMGQGTGLGLSMIHGFARQSGGQVRIYTEPGKGTTMCLYFPRFAGELEAPEAAEDAIDATTSQGETVLVIDDEKAIRDLIAEVLGEAGYRVLEAPDGPAGLAILQTGVRIDLLITDVGLPGGLNGRQVADAARSHRPDLKVLFVTGYAENAVVGNGHLDAGMEVMTKPFAIAALATRVRDIIEG